MIYIIITYYKCHKIYSGSCHPISRDVDLKLREVNFKLLKTSTTNGTDSL